MIKHMLSTLICLLVAETVAAQTKITGKVTDNAGIAIPGANVSIENSYDGCSTANDGTFQFATDKTGIAILSVTFVGYKTHEQQIELSKGSVTLNVVLKESINQLEAVTITAGAFTASDESRRTIFRALDIATTAGATADIAGALNTLPGTQKVGESGRLFVRGGEGHETRTFIDGMWVLDAYGPAAPNTASRGRFLPFMFKGTSFSTGGYSSEYGQALSSVLALDSKDKQEITRTDIGLLSVGADVSHTHVWRQSSIAGKIQYTNIQPYYTLIRQEVDWKEPYSSIEASSAFRQQIGRQGLLKVYGNFNTSDFSLYQHDIAQPTQKQLLRLKNKYGYFNTFYKDALSEKWSIRGGFSYTSIANTTDIDVTNQEENESGIHTKTVVEGSLSDRVELKTGIEVTSRWYNQYNTYYTKDFNETITATFAEADLYASNHFVVRTGVRAEYFNLLNSVGIDPRLSLGYKTGKDGQFSLAYGTFRQTPKNEWLRENKKLSQERAQHIVANYQYINNNRTFRVETYYKKYNQLTTFTTNSLSNSTNNGKGYAQGAELFWRDNQTLKNTDYWISYSYLNTKRIYLNYPEEAIPPFASAHNFSVVYKYFVSKLKTQIGATYSFSSARSFHNPNEEKFMAGRTPAYHDLSINISYLPKNYLILYFSCTNVLGRDNIFGYEYTSTPDANGVFASRAIRQPAKNFLFVGVFITLSKDKGMNQLPSL